ncbi:hypothetical protein M0R45_008228 [Rubus argutus]|uniref:Uncharacterized protein n=1 Tax=Rubus argutus TaxID=59490 RepID=A0AAW1Y1G1_RUBAR
MNPRRRSRNLQSVPKPDHLLTAAKLPPLPVNPSPALPSLLPIADVNAQTRSSANPAVHPCRRSPIVADSAKR